PSKRRAPPLPILERSSSMAARLARQESLPLRGDPIALAANLIGFRRGVSHVLKPRKRGIGDAWAWGITATHLLLNSLHQLVPVARLIANHLQSQESELSVIEGPAPRRPKRRPCAAANDAPFDYVVGAGVNDPPPARSKAVIGPSLTPSLPAD